MSAFPAEAVNTTPTAAEVITSCHKLANTSLGVYPASHSLSTSAASTDKGSMHLCEVLIKKGKWTTSMGHARDKGREYLFVEEMLYLLSDGSLEVLYNSMPLSIAEGYAVLAQRDVPHALVDGPSAYMAYSSLRDQGFVLMRPQQYHQVYSRVHAKPTYTKEQIILNNEYAKQQAEAKTDSNDNPRKRKAESSLEESSVESEPTITEPTDVAPPTSIPSDHHHNNNATTTTTLFYGAQPPRRAEAKRLPRGFKPQPRSDETIAMMHQEASRLKQMQAKLGAVSGIRNLFTFESESYQKKDINSTVAEAIDTVLPAESTSLPTATAITHSAPTFSPPLSDELFRLLSTPCDFFYVWLPPSHAASIAAEMGCIAKTFKRSEPSLPDFICICTNPRLTYEKVWAVLSHCSRGVIQTFNEKRSEKATSSSSSSTSSIFTGSNAISSCVGDVMSRLYELSDERLVAFHDHPATHSPTFSPLIHLRLAVMPMEHASRVFFVDATVMTPKEYLNADEMPRGLNSMLEIMADSRKH